MTIQLDQRSKAPVIAIADDVIALQITRWSGQRVAATMSASSQRLTLPANTLVVEITAQQDAYISFGDGTVDAESTIANDDSRLFAAGVQVVAVPLDNQGVPYTHVAVLEAATAGIIQFEKVD
jgi:hypothetical protein